MQASAAIPGLNVPSNGMVFNIMRFSVHDGPGIRTTVFLKGCPLRCLWCHNPESQSPHTELIYFEERCLRCGDCVRCCPNRAIHLNGRLVHNPGRCQVCGQCVDACSAGAREIAGRRMRVDEVIAEIAKDQVFFDESGGGVTFSGGEPLMQPAFLEAALATCRARRIRTALDTCGFVNISTLKRVRPLVDVFLYDLKVMDAEQHRRFTGVDNDVILHNLRFLAESGSRIIIRLPVIPTVNDTAANIQALTAFLSPLGLRDIDLLPYHRIGSDKYLRLRRENPMGDIAPPTEEQMDKLARLLQRKGFCVRMGG